MATGRVPTTANSPLTAKGDLFTYSTAPARLAVGNDGETIVADSSTSTGLRYQSNFAAGKNKIINGDFGVWQRGTSASVAGYNIYGTADRFCYSSIGGTATASRQTFTPGTAPVAGYEGQYFSRLTLAASGTTYFDTLQFVEDVRTLAGQTVTFSYWAKASTGMAVAVTFFQNMGSGGSGTLQTNGTPVTLTTSWVRYSQTVTLPSLAGSTVGTSSKLGIGIGYSSGGTLANATFDVWGVQLEAGSVATAFQTATGTIQGELAACQRYYQQVVNGNTQNIGVGWNYSSSYAISMLYLPVVMRTAPTIAVTSGTNYYAFERNGGLDYVNAFFGAANTNPNNAITLRNSTEISGTAGQAGLFFSDNASANISLSAEL